MTLGFIAVTVALTTTTQSIQDLINTALGAGTCPAMAREVILQAATGNASTVFVSLSGNDTGIELVAPGVGVAAGQIHLGTSQGAQVPISGIYLQGASATPSVNILIIA